MRLASRPASLADRAARGRLLTGGPVAEADTGDGGHGPPYASSGRRRREAGGEAAIVGDPWCI